MTELNGAEYNAVFFDLDGTLVDTAPDMVALLQQLQREHGIEPVSYELARSYVSNGSIGLLTLGFPELEVQFGDEMHQNFLELVSGAYSKKILNRSRELRSSALIFFRVVMSRTMPCVPTTFPF